MGPLTAAFNVVHDHPGGAEALAPLLSKAGATLSHEVNPNYPTYKLRLVDAAKITLITKDCRILNAFAAMCGYYPPAPMLVAPMEDLGLAELMRRCGKVATEAGDVIGQFHERGADGDISPNDAAAIQEEIDQAIQALSAFSEALRAHVERQQKSRGKAGE